MKLKYYACNVCGEKEENVANLISFYDHEFPPLKVCPKKNTNLHICTDCLTEITAYMTEINRG
jgi:hypothetical protein